MTSRYARTDKLAKSLKAEFDKMAAPYKSGEDFARNTPMVSPRGPYVDPIFECAKSYAKAAEYLHRVVSPDKRKDLTDSLNHMIEFFLPAATMEITKEMHEIIAYRNRDRHVYNFPYHGAMDRKLSATDVVMALEDALAPPYP